MPRSCSRLLAFTVLLCSACAQDVPPPPAAKPAVVELDAPATAPTAGNPPESVKPVQPSDSLLGWWLAPDALANLGLTAAEGAAMASELGAMENSYQTAQRQLPTVEHTQMRMLLDPRVPSADIRRFNRQNLQELLTSMVDQDIAARLWVREHLSADRLAQVLKRSPEFFEKSWFRAAGDPLAR